MVIDESSPPADAPWLVSTVTQLKENAVNLRAWKQRWYCDFPGAQASHDAKNAWAKRIEADARKADAALDATRPHEPTQILRHILLGSTTEVVFVQLLVATCKLPELRLEQCARTTIYGTHAGAPDFSVLASGRKPRMARTQDVLDLMLSHLGLPVSTYVRCAPAAAGLAAEADINFHLPEYLGEALSFPGPTPTVAFEVLRLGEAESDLERTCRERARNYKGLGFLFVRRLAATAAELASVTKATHHVLWFAEEGEVDRVRRHLRWGEGEAEHVKKALDARTPAAADLKLRMVIAELEHVRTMRAADGMWRRRLAALLAVSLELVNDPAFLALSSHPTTVVETLRDVANYWRTQILKNDLRLLGLGLPGDEPSAASSHEALLTLLRLIKTQLEGYRIMHDAQPYEIRFPCLPRKAPKKAAAAKRRTSANSAQPRMAPPTSTGTGSSASAGAGGAGHTRPAGRNPVDSHGDKMFWNHLKGVWVSKNNPDEFKVPGKKRGTSDPAALTAAAAVVATPSPTHSQAPSADAGAAALAAAPAVAPDAVMPPPPPPPPAEAAVAPDGTM